MRLTNSGWVFLLGLMLPAFSHAADSDPQMSPAQERSDLWEWEKKDLGAKIIKDEDGPLALGAAFTWGFRGKHEASRWNCSADTSGQLQTDSNNNSTPLKVGASLAGFGQIDPFVDQDPFDADLSVTAPVIDLGLHTSAEANQRFTESLALVGLEARFENRENAQGIFSILPDVTASIDLAQRFASDAREKLGLSESDAFTRWSVAALWNSNLGYWTPGRCLEPFFVHFGIWHTEELSPDPAWKDSGLYRSTGWKVELETQAAKWIGDRHSGVLTAASIIVGYESGVLAPATTENNTLYLLVKWNGQKLF